MKIIPLINEITNTFNENFKNGLNPLNLERKDKYNIKETKKGLLLLLLV